MEMPVNTIRAWVIGGILCTIVAACNILLNLRRTPISISSTVVQLIAYPYEHLPEAIALYSFRSIDR